MPAAETAAAIAAIVGTGVSIYQAAHSAKLRRNAEKRLENMANNAPTYKPNQSILNYYDEALRRYNTPATESAEYKANKQNIQQGTQQGLAASRDRRLGGALIPALIQNQNNSLLKASALGEQRKAGEFATLGSATNMRAADQNKEWAQNNLYPFEAQYNLLAMKAAGQAQVQNQSMQNASNGLMSLGTMAGSGAFSGSGKNVGGYNFTNREYNRLNSAWSKNRANYAAY